MLRRRCGPLLSPSGVQLDEIVFPVTQVTSCTFSGQAGRTLRAQFDDCKVTTGPDTTTLRAELRDQAALSGLVERMVGLGLEVIDVHLVTPPNTLGH